MRPGYSIASELKKPETQSGQWRLWRTMDYSAEVLNALLHELETLQSRPAVKARLEMLRSLPGKGTNLFPHAFVSIAALPYVTGERELPDAAIFEPYLARFKRHWSRLDEVAAHGPTLSK